MKYPFKKRLKNYLLKAMQSGAIEWPKALLNLHCVYGARRGNKRAVCERPDTSIAIVMLMSVSN